MDVDVVIIGDGLAGQAAGYVIEAARHTIRHYWGETSAPPTGGPGSPVLAGLPTWVTTDGDAFLVQDTAGDVTARSIVLTPGTAPRRLNLPGEERLVGHGISFCVTCDGPKVRGGTAVVYGGGNAGFNAALELVRFASHVTLLVPEGSPRPEAIVSQKAAAHPRVAVTRKAVLTDLIGQEHLERIRYTVDGAAHELPVAGLFVALGLRTELLLLGEQLEHDDWGALITSPEGETSLPGVYAVAALRSGHAAADPADDGAQVGRAIVARLAG